MFYTIIVPIATFFVGILLITAVIQFFDNKRIVRLERNIRRMQEAHSAVLRRYGMVEGKLNVLITYSLRNDGRYDAVCNIGGDIFQHEAGESLVECTKYLGDAIYVLLGIEQSLIEFKFKKIPFSK